MFLVFLVTFFFLDAMATCCNHGFQKGGQPLHVFYPTTTDEWFYHFFVSSDWDWARVKFEKVMVKWLLIGTEAAKLGIYQQNIGGNEPKQLLDKDLFGAIQKRTWQ